jgi:hypothetical protein
MLYLHAKSLAKRFPVRFQPVGFLWLHEGLNSIPHGAIKNRALISFSLVVVHPIRTLVLAFFIVLAIRYTWSAFSFSNGDFITALF